MKRNGKYIRLLICSICILGLSGCGYMDEATTHCTVFSVEGTSGSHEYICKNSTDTYIYHENAIYNYATMEKVIDVKDLTCMACNDDVLYYAVEYPWQLFCYNFQTKETTVVKEDCSVEGMKANGDDIFVAYTFRDEERQEYVIDLDYFKKDEQGIHLNDWVAENEPKKVEDIYEIYEFEGYNILTDTTIEEENRIIYIENDEFEYSCYVLHKSPFHDRSYCTCSKLGDEYIRLNREVRCRFRGEEKVILEILKEVNETEEDTILDSGLTASQIGAYQDKIYILEQYGRLTPAYTENVRTYFKKFDAFFELTPEIGECKLLYKVKKNEQIAGFSMKHNCLFLLRNSGVYQYDLESGDENQILENKEYEELAFEYMDDILFIFEVKNDGYVKFLKAVE